MIDIDTLPHADTPHRYAATSCGRIAEQMLAMHPRAAEATADEVTALVALLAIETPGIAEYQIGGELGGQLGELGTWVGIATTPGKQRVLQLSPYVDAIYDERDPVPDPTVLERVRAELERLAAEHADKTGETVPIPRLLRRETDILTGRQDKIVHEAPGGEDSFTGAFSHKLQPAMDGFVLKVGFDQIARNHRHWDAVAKAIADTAERARKRFRWLGATTGQTHLVSVDEDKDGNLVSVATTTALDVLADDLRPHTVMLNLRNPPRLDPGEMDGWKVHARDQKRRMAVLDGRDPVDAMTVCPVLFRTIPMLRPAGRALLRQGLRQAAGIARYGPEDEEMERIARGISIRDGHIVGTVDMPRGTWRGRTLLVPDMALPSTVTLALTGRTFSAVMDEPRIADLVIAKAVTDSKGRLNVTMKAMPGVPLRDALAACEA